MRNIAKKEEIPIGEAKRKLELTRGSWAEIAREPRLAKGKSAFQGKPAIQGKPQFFTNLTPDLNANTKESDSEIEQLKKQLSNALNRIKKLEIKIEVLEKESAVKNAELQSIRNENVILKQRELGFDSLIGINNVEEQDKDIQQGKDWGDRMDDLDIDNDTY